MLPGARDSLKQEHSRCDASIRFACLFEFKRISSLQVHGAAVFALQQASSSCLPHTLRGSGPSRSHILPFCPSSLSDPFLLTPFVCLPPFLRQTPIFFRRRSEFKSWQPSLRQKSTSEIQHPVIHMFVTTVDGVSARLGVSFQSDTLKKVPSSSRLAVSLKRSSWGT